MSKGSRQRPREISRAEWERRYEQHFGDPKTAERFGPGWRHAFVEPLSRDKVKQGGQPRRST